MTTYDIRAGTAHTMGVTHDGDGANFAVFSANADRIELCLFSEDGRKETARLTLPERTGPVWHGYVPGLPYGTLYGYRAHGLYAPDQGHRFNPHKLLIDPYTRELSGDFTNDPATYGFDLAHPERDRTPSKADSAAYVPKSVISHPDLFEPALAPLDGRPLSELIYEAHPKGLTIQHPDIEERLRGTYEGLCADPILDHLDKLGVTTVELLPVHAFPDDGFLLDKGLRNYWGYNTIGFFAPSPRYFGPAGFAGFRHMVRRFHEAGIRVILDVVYNHTAEGDHLGPTLCYRGLDNASYYRLIPGQRRFYVNDTGTGNTLDLTRPYVLRMVLDSLRFWVTQMGVDGFRFDLATTLGREAHGFDPHGGFFDALRQDPVLSKTRLIAEPWDIGPGGYQLGSFPHEFSEWNDTFRDTVRGYWRGDPHATQSLGGKLLGSADPFDRDGRRPWASVNFVTAHDGFTLADTCAYAEKHNEANLEDNRDGHSHNVSDNMGVEGPTDDPEILAARAQRARNLLATVFLSQGTPMILAGDEMGNSQGGNNNAYCQDNEIGWVDWTGDAALTAFVSRLSAFRRQHSVLRQLHFLHGRKRAADALPDVVWRDFAGQPLEWRDPGLDRLVLVLRSSAETTVGEDDADAVLLAFNRSEKPGRVKLPRPPSGGRWVRRIDTAAPDAAPTAETGTAAIAGASVLALSIDMTGGPL
ncbi:glycogen debranching protein GlgX [Jannaschia seohaensis]|uniref:Glycogen operon protein n=1 Tax=Jannaschia seohaensis TaxID=475081 RepID=A0A2Y9ABX5_9RHOB|nr:glycogen debranching protein GlgX [Jannaschia seohaensis]PWJ21285.1 glycogen operon protein [Jannaschia seohaensis]SSA41695.1 glycogen operon protein [Jannaschia seohaensis]